MRETGAVAPLPDFRDPPVIEIVAAVQFRPLPQFGMPEALEVARATPEWRILDAPPALDPIVESPSAQVPAAQFRLGFGAQPVRLLLEREERWLAQLQQDRLAAHERKTANGGRPSFANVVPALQERREEWSRALGRTLLAGDHAAELVEVTYINWIPLGHGWSSLADLHDVLHVVRPIADDAPVPEQMSLSFSSALERHDGSFGGRLRVVAEPGVRQDAGGLHLQLMSRRYLSDDLDATLDDCHADIVRGFAAVTTKTMHDVWGRLR